MLVVVALPEHLIYFNLVKLTFCIDVEGVKAHIWILATEYMVVYYLLEDNTLHELMS